MRIKRASKPWPDAFCICGQKWWDDDHQSTYRVDSQYSPWRGNPAELRAFDQWFRENMPASSGVAIAGGERGGITKSGDDGMVRLYTNQNPHGVVALQEIKTNGRELDNPTSKVFQCLLENRVAPPYIIRMDGGNCPSVPKHFPMQHRDLGLPEMPMPAAHVYFSVWGSGINTMVSSNELVTCIMEHLMMYVKKPELELF